VLRMSDDVERRVDAVWSELGIGGVPAKAPRSNGAGHRGEAAGARLLRAARVALGRES
jgi:hypothetical protein